MIDTDKYEGHLIDKAVENYSQVWCWSKWMLKNAETIEQHKATSTLLEDAPLLLAEYKKLRQFARLSNYSFSESLPELMQALVDERAEVKRLRAVMIYVEQRQPHPALEWALKEGLTLTEIRERIE